MFGKILVTHQTGPEGKKLKKYITRGIRYRQRNIIYLV